MKKSSKRSPNSKKPHEPLANSPGSERAGATDSLNTSSVRQTSDKQTLAHRFTSTLANNELDTLLALRTRQDSRFWCIGVIACVILLTAQLLYFESYAWTQNAQIRTYLVRVCHLAGCRLPDYRNISEWKINGSLNQSADDSYRFQASLKNEALFPQALPNIKMILKNFSGNPFAIRIFRPHEYLSDFMTSALIKPGQSIEIMLTIAAPKFKVGGSFFEVVP